MVIARPRTFLFCRPVRIRNVRRSEILFKSANGGSSITSIGNRAVSKQLPSIKRKDSILSQSFWSIFNDLKKSTIQGIRLLFLWVQAVRDNYWRSSWRKKFRILPDRKSSSKRSNEFSSFLKASF